MELPESAARALQTLRGQGHRLRFTVDEVCHSSRFRLSARWFPAEGEEVRLGLLYADDEAALKALRDRLGRSPTSAGEPAPEPEAPSPREAKRAGSVPE